MLVTVSSDSATLLTIILCLCYHGHHIPLNLYIFFLQAKDRCTGIEIDGRRIRVDYSITERAHTPTPGIYLGKPTS